MSRPTTTADTSPISPARFAAALPPLSLPTLHLKVLEIRNSIAHLRTSNIELLPYALGTEPAGGAPDPDCADAIRENEAVILRMDERIALIRAEVEDRGVRAATTQTAAPSASGGGRLDDEQLRRAMEERMRQLDDDDGGMHL
ncbi:D-arabinitol 2-dehydrogenase [ribulose-forming] [Verticillium dahliae VDG2]|nr:D-arabinitol 2-dehydrogenase [ribulose-forming] [Verticillium dahliae VDG2]